MLTQNNYCIILPYQAGFVKRKISARRPESRFLFFVLCVWGGEKSIWETSTYSDSGHPKFFKRCSLSTQTAPGSRAKSGRNTARSKRINARQTRKRLPTHCQGSCFQYCGPSLVCVFPAVDLPWATYLRRSMVNSAATSGFFSYRLFISFGSATRSYS